MDGKGSWKDNVFVERLWKSVKYEEVYLRAYESVPEARTGLGRYFEFYNAGRPHSSLGGMTPDQFFERPRRRNVDSSGHAGVDVSSIDGDVRSQQRNDHRHEC